MQKVRAANLEKTQPKKGQTSRAGKWLNCIVFHKEYQGHVLVLVSKHSAAFKRLVTEMHRHRACSPAVDFLQVGYIWNGECCLICSHKLKRETNLHFQSIKTHRWCMTKRQVTQDNARTENVSATFVQRYMILNQRLSKWDISSPEGTGIKLGPWIVHLWLDS